MTGDVGSLAFDLRRWAAALSDVPDMAKTDLIRIADGIEAQAVEIEQIEKLVPRDVAETWKAKAENLSVALKRERMRHDDLLSQIMAHAVQAQLDPRFAKDQAWEIEQLIVAEKIKP